ncbi:cytidylate kinase-like family protein [Collinsella sp. AGMB00827]|uniref:Cytidylate kinase-like family protein n=2 Tax=Collinsella ureilytica TaxID=2869515 RepID=A0ABS7ML14_9ACTN|nr:cytidylate kinase-like family protein [Collinsella urealyticum]
MFKKSVTSDRWGIEEPVIQGDVMRAGQPVVITIARDYGAEGHEIGKMLSEELGIPLYDNELLVRASLRSGEAIDELANYDERMAPDFMAFLPDRMDTRTLSDRLFSSMSEVIVDLGASESCIIEGRLSDYLLRQNPNHIAVLVTAPFDDRVQIVADKRGLSKRKATRLVRRMQRAREAFYKRYSAGKWRLSDGKDLVVNRSKLGRAGCVEVIAAAYRSKLAALGLSEAPARVSRFAPLNAQAAVETASANEGTGGKPDADGSGVLNGACSSASEPEVAGEASVSAAESEAMTE